MSVDANRKVVRRFIEEIVNTGDVSNIDEIVSPDYVEVHANKVYEVGLEGARDHILGVRRTYPDLHLTIEQQIAEGEWVATRVTARGTHTGEWLGIRPTGKKLEFTGVNLDRVVDGKIVEHGGAADMLTPLLDAGAVRIVGD